SNGSRRSSTRRSTWCVAVTGSQHSRAQCWSAASPAWRCRTYPTDVPKRVAAQTHGHRQAAKRYLWYFLSQILRPEVSEEEEEVAEHAGANPLEGPLPRSHSCHRGRARSGRDRSDGWQLEQGEVDTDPGQRGVRDHDGELDRCGPYADVLRSPVRGDERAGRCPRRLRGSRCLGPPDRA